MIVCITVAIGGQDHNIAVRSSGVNDVLGATNIVSSIVDSQDVVSIQAIMLEQNAIELILVRIRSQID